MKFMSNATYALISVCAELSVARACPALEASP